MGAATSYEEAVSAVVDTLSTSGFVGPVEAIRVGSVGAPQLLLTIGFGNALQIKQLFVALGVLSIKDHDTLMALVYGSRMLGFSAPPLEKQHELLPSSVGMPQKKTRPAPTQRSKSDETSFGPGLIGEQLQREQLQRQREQQLSQQQAMFERADSSPRSELPEWSHAKVDYGNSPRPLPARPKSASASTRHSPRTTKKCVLMQQVAAAKMTAYEHSQKPHMRLGAPLPGQHRASALTSRFGNPLMEDTNAFEHYVQSTMTHAQLAVVWWAMEDARDRLADPACRTWMRLFQRFNVDGSGRLNYDQFRQLLRNQYHHNPPGLGLDLKMLPKKILLGLWTILDEHRIGSVIIEEWTEFCRRATKIAENYRIELEGHGRPNAEMDENTVLPAGMRLMHPSTDNIHAANVYRNALRKAIYS